MFFLLRPDLPRQSHEQNVWRRVFRKTRNAILHTSIANECNGSSVNNMSNEKTQRDRYLSDNGCAKIDCHQIESEPHIRHVYVEISISPMIPLDTATIEFFYWLDIYHPPAPRNVFQETMTQVTPTLIYRIYNVFLVTL